MQVVLVLVRETTLRGAISDEFEIAGGRLSICVFAALNIDGRKERMGFESRSLWYGWNFVLGVAAERVAVNEDVLIARSTALRRDDMCKVFLRYFVDNSYQTFRPVIFVVLSCLLDLTICTIAEAWLFVGHTREIEGELYGWCHDVELGDRPDLALPPEGLRREIGAITQVENRL